ncbi:unnamed protein product [Schistocephalus solidus]|uniref:Ubiquitin carboxyl-terminal hydrolase n=1 Tax=Schistocephalus solidus TaxID=70667 RepID=A0A3P7EFC1_SCHSO|nr:unnamed protein product [Schistocephalus solidus]
MLACAHCVYFACYTNLHIEKHLESHPDHFICASVFFISTQVSAYSVLPLTYFNSLSERPWRPSYKDLEFLPHLQSISTPLASANLRPPHQLTDDVICRLQFFKNIPFLLATRGLVNMGNTCFLNVVVQALTHTPLLRDFLLADLHRCENPVRSRNCLACEMIRITQEIYRPVLSPYVPSNLLHTIWLHASHLAGYEQRDAHEFLITLLTLIHSHLVGEQAPREDDADDLVLPAKRRVPQSDLCGKTSRSASPASAGSSTSFHNHHPPSHSHLLREDLPSKHLSSACSSSCLANEFVETSRVASKLSGFSNPPSSASSSVVEEDALNGDYQDPPASSPTPSSADLNGVFFGDLESVISYQGCDHRSSTVDPFLDLSLDVAQRGSTSLAACLSSYFRPEAIDGLLFCSQCRVGRPAVKQFSLLHLPNVLCFYLKRCHHDTKITTSINFPVELDITPFVAQFSSSKSSWQDRYSLYAVLNHSGQTNSGHYTACIRFGPGCWCLCDDQKIVPVSVDYVLTTDAYVLLYHKNVLAVRS